MQGPDLLKNTLRDRIKLPARYLLLILSALCILLIVITFNVRSFTGPFSTFGNYFIVPLQRGVTRIGDGLILRTQNRKDLEALREENAELKEEVERLTGELTGLREQEYELLRLRELYETDVRYDAYETLGAQVIAKDTGNWYHSFIVDKGEADGVRADMNVLAAGGLVGRITRTGQHWARVETIIDDNSNVSGSVLATADNLMVEGSLQSFSRGVISFGHLLDEEGAVMEGDKVVTSNISNRYLPGILIGYITSIELDPNNITRSGEITPAVDFSHINNVLIILQTKQIPEEADVQS